MPYSKGAPRVLNGSERRIKALELRRRGRSYREIGEALGCSESRAWTIIMEEMKRIMAERKEEAAVIVRMENERLDTLLDAVWDKATKGDVKCVEAVLKIMSRRATMMGYDAPTKQETSFSFPSLTNDELAAQARQLGVNVPAELEDGMPQPQLTHIQDAEVVEQNETERVGREDEA